MAAPVHLELSIISSGSIDELADNLEEHWDIFVEPILEPILEIFGIEDETVIDVFNLSSPVFSNDPEEDIVKGAAVKAILAMVRRGGDFFPYYMEQINEVKGQLKAYYNYAYRGNYTEGLPDAHIQGNSGDLSVVRANLNSYVGSTCSLIGVNRRMPPDDLYFKHKLQSTHAYQYWDNTLTLDDPWGVSRNDWKIVDVVYNTGPMNFSINVRRNDQETKFWLEGPKQITEGDTATFVVKSNRPIPVSDDMDLEITIGGTAVAATDYSGTAVRTITMLSGTSEIEFDIVTLETGNANRTMDVELTDIVNTGALFPIVTIHTPSSQLCTITDDDTLRLTVNDVLVDEANTTITLYVKCEAVAPSGAFSVDYNFTDLGTIVGGTDYDNTTGTLNFTGAAGNVQTIDIDIYADVADDDKEQFEVWFDNSDDVDGVDISVVSTVTIFDGTLDPAAISTSLDAVITEADYVKEDSSVIFYQNQSDPPNQEKLWIYKISDGTYPGLDQEVSIAVALEMMPIVVLRTEGVSVANFSTARYQSARQMINRLGYQIDDFLDNINANPDSGEIDDVWINFSVQPNDTHQVLSKILWLQWHETIVRFAITSNEEEYLSVFEEGDIQMSMAWTEHSHTVGLTGVKATVGEYAHTVFENSEVISTTKVDQHGEEYQDDVTHYFNELHMWYQTDTNTYDEMKVIRLSGLTATTYNNGSAIAFTKLGDDEFTIPMSWFIFEKLTAKEQLRVYKYIFRMNFHALVETDLPYYLTGSFFNLFKMVVLVLSIVYMDWSGTWYAIALELIKQYAINYAIGELIVWAAEETGNPELAAAVGLIVSIYLNNTSGIDFDIFLQAETLINMASEYAINLAFIEGEEQQRQIEQLEDEAEERQEEIRLEDERREESGRVNYDTQILAHLLSSDTSRQTAIQSQYNYDLLYNYDSLTSNYHAKLLKIGVI